MVKNLRFVFMSIVMLICGSAFAQTEFDFENATTMFGLPGESSGSGASAVNDGNFTEDKTATIGDFSVTVSATAEGASTPNRIWNSTPKLRLYSGTLTISSTGAPIKKILFTINSQASKAKWAEGNTVSTGTIDASAKTTVTWTGEAQEIVINIAGNTQIAKLVINGEEQGGGDPVTPDPQPTDEATAVTVEQFNAAAVSNDVWYQLTGTVKNLADGDQYGNFDLEDETGSVYVYGLLAEKGGAKKQFQDLVVAKGIQNGSKLTLIGNRGVHKEKIEVTNAYFVSIDNSGVEETVDDVVEVSSISAFQALEVGTVAKLTLTNAQVVYINDYNGTKELFIRDADDNAMDLYNLGIEAEVGQVLNGTIIGSRPANNGFTYVMKKHSQTDVSTVTVGTKQEVAPTVIEALDELTYDAYGCDLVKICGVTISEDLKKAEADGESVALYDRFKTNLLTGLDLTKQYDITGLVYDGGESFGTELVITAITLAGGGEIVEDPATSVASIEALLALESPSTNLELTLTDAKVLFNDNNYIYMRENGKALCFYKIDGLKDVAKNNAVVNGKIQVDYEVYKNLPEVKANKHTNLDGLTIVESEEAAEPVETTLADVAAGKNVCDLVTLTATLVKEVTYKDDGVSVKSTTYYLQDGETKIVCVNNGKGLNNIEEGTVITVTGIVNTSNDAYQIKLTTTVKADSGEGDGIKTVKMADAYKGGIYNLAGQRVETMGRGFYIINGKKVIMK